MHTYIHTCIVPWAHVNLHPPHGISICSAVLYYSAQSDRFNAAASVALAATSSTARGATD